MQCYTNIAVKEDHPITIEIRLPGHPTPLLVKGIVCWVQPLAEERFKIGVRFVSLAGIFRRRLLQYLQKLSMKAFSEQNEDS